ncbi:hypothetical protein EIP86_005857 [Pleurotus ostreatoroseus]|nr:hypothetical protein EIP86_005857 [Pleurotus ostreatoroseus]
MIPMQGNRPSRTTDVVAWENSWAKDLARSYSPNQKKIMRLISVMSSELIKGHESDSYLLSIDKQVRETCDLQAELIREVLKVRSEFEQGWRALPKTRRDALILGGISHACTAPYIEDERGLCPEISLPELSARNGEAFLDLLRRFVPDDASAAIKPTEPTCLPHSVLSRYLALTEKEKERLGCRMFVRYRELSRAYFMTLALWSIFQLYYGRRERYDVAKNIHFEEELKPMIKDAIGKDAYKEIMKMSKGARKESPRACWLCGATPSADKSLQACSRCRTIGRDIYYCSKECQVKDWKEGIPRPHKEICGKTSLSDAY